MSYEQWGIDDDIPRKVIFNAHTDWARDYERRGFVKEAQMLRNNRWRQCPHGPAERPGRHA